MFPYQDIIQGIDQLMAHEIPFLLRLSEENDEHLAQMLYELIHMISLKIKSII